MSKDASLYGIPRHAAKPPKKQLASSNDLSFSSALSSLISSSSTTASKPTAARPKRPKDKDDIFTTHNRNAKKRALADLQAAQDDPASSARWKGKDAPLDDAVWRRTRRKMEDKARLYAALKRGDVEDDGDSDNPKHMVDFDRKWAERRDADDPPSPSSDSESDGNASDEEQVEYTDAFGRTRRGTRADAAREQRHIAAGARLAAESDRYSARPQAPSGLIVGDTIQTAAFDPDEPVAAQMAALAGQRDRAPTPPEALHYDASAEIRTRGTGFFAFSRDEETRAAQMEGLERERRETERVRAEAGGRETKRDERRRAVEERRRQIVEKKERKAADSFLEALESEIAERNEQHEA